MSETNQSIEQIHGTALIEPNVPVVKMQEWLVTFILLSIPFLNIVMLFVWAFSKDINPNKANFAKASLILPCIIISVLMLMVLIFIVFSLVLYYM